MAPSENSWDVQIRRVLPSVTRGIGPLPPAQFPLSLLSFWNLSRARPTCIQFNRTGAMSRYPAKILYARSNSFERRVGEGPSIGVASVFRASYLWPVVRVIRVHKRVYASDAKQQRTRREIRWRERKKRSRRSPLLLAESCNNTGSRGQSEFFFLRSVLVHLLHYAMLTSVHKRSFVTTCYYTRPYKPRDWTIQAGRDKLETAPLTSNSDNLIAAAVRVVVRRQGKRNDSLFLSLSLFLSPCNERATRRGQF